MILTKVMITILAVARVSRARNISSMTLPKNMKAVGLYRYLPLSDNNCLLDLVTGLPEMKESDVLVQVKTVAMNPIDTKIRAPKPDIEKKPRILGWDGAGVVVATGKSAKLFNVGDEVMFTGELGRNGSNAQYVALSEICAARKPTSLTFEEAAAMPLTSVTAYEALYDRLQITEKDNGKSLLVINSAGGVGSVATQLARHLGLKVIGTASRPETVAFTQKNGADLVLNHTNDLIPQLNAAGYAKGVDYILVNYDPYPYWNTLAQAIKPQGKICLIVDNSGLVDLKLLKDKSVTLVYEMMATRLKYDTDDKFRHHEILKDISKMLDNKVLKSTLCKTMSPINADNVKKAHKLLEGKHLIGKLVLTGF